MFGPVTTSACKIRMGLPGSIEPTYVTIIYIPCLGLSLNLGHLQFWAKQAVGQKKVPQVGLVIWTYSPEVGPTNAAWTRCDPVHSSPKPRSRETEVTRRAARLKDPAAEPMAHLPKRKPGGCSSLNLSVAQSRPFDLLVFPFWSSFSHGPKRLTFYFWVLWASEILFLQVGILEMW